jgi:NCS1 family nucleobase:cation symporter-1
VAIVVSLPFWNNPLYTGWVPQTWPQVGDLTFVVGFVVAAVVYAILTRTAGRAPAVVR